MHFDIPSGTGLPIKVGLVYPMSQDRTWQRGPVAHQYSLIVGDCQALVWQQPMGRWAALISRDQTAVTERYFKNLMEAQLWCEARLAQLQAKP